MTFLERMNSIRTVLTLEFMAAFDCSPKLLQNRLLFGLSVSTIALGSA